MAWTTISKRAIGDCIPKSWLDTFIDNLTHLYNIAGGSGGTASDGLLNGSFENDVDADGIPDGWARTLYSGGSFAIETTSPAHGAKAIKFTSSGTGGGYLTTEDYILCSVSSVVNIQFVIWATAVGVHNLVELLWYDKAKGYLSTTAIFDDTATNPASATRYVRGAVPVASAEFYKIRLTGCKSDDATAGTTYFDDVRIVPGADTVVGFAEVADSAVYLDRVTIGGTLASPTIGLELAGAFSLLGARKNVSGGSVAVASATAGPAAIVTVTLDLPVGLWTILGTATTYNNATDTRWHGITAVAIREG